MRYLTLFIGFLAIVRREGFAQGPFVCPEIGFFPVSPESCTSHYYACSEGYTLDILKCPQDSTLFDPIITNCVTDVEASCYPLALTCPEPDGFFAIPGACTPVYYICVGSIPYEDVCPSGSTFDPDRLACARSDTVACYNDKSTTVAPFICPPEDGKYPDPDPTHSCSDYYVCVSGVKFPTNCPYEWCFDPNVRECSSTYTVALTV